MGMKREDVIAMIETGIPGAHVEIQDLAGDNDHYAATVTAAQFKGMSLVQQHKMVYDTLLGKMGGELHALSLKTLVPTDQGEEND